MVGEAPAPSAADFLRIARRQPVRSRVIALVLNGLFFGWLAAIFIGVIYFMLENDTSGGSARVILAVALFFGGLLAFPLHYLASKLGAASAIDVLREDPRSPVLFLRGFAADRDHFLTRWIKRPAAIAGWRKDDGVTHEEKLVHALRSVGPVVAIGRPGEKWPTLGASRLYVPQAHWRETVRHLASEAAITVIQLGDSPGLWWEVEYALQTLRPERLLLYLPTPADGGAETAYQAFRQRAESLLPHQLPPSCGDAAFIAFDRVWHPVFLKADSPLLFDARPPVLLFAPTATTSQENSTRRDLEALSTVFSGIGPVVLLGNSDLRPPRAIQSWMALTEEELRTLPEQESWGDGPIVLLGAGASDGLERLQSMIGIGDPQRTLVFVPPFVSASRASAHAALDGAICKSARCPQDFTTADAAYVFFDRAWRPQAIKRSLWASPGWLGWLRRRGRAVRRCKALLLKDLFRRHGRRTPGHRMRRASWLLPAGLALLIGLIVGDLNRVRYDLRLTADHDIEANWQGVAWGLPAEQVAALFSGLDPGGLDDSGDEITNLESGEAMTIADQELIMLLSFFRQRLVGAVLYSQHNPEAKAEALAAELARLYGAPERVQQGLRWERGPIVILMALRETAPSDGSALALDVVFRNVDLFHELRKEAPRD